MKQLRSAGIQNRAPARLADARVQMLHALEMTRPADVERESPVADGVCLVGAGCKLRAEHVRHYRSGGRKRPKSSSAACRRVRESGSDGRREALRGKGC